LDEGARLRPGDKLLVASHNAGKVREIADLLTPHGLETVSAASLGLIEPEETGQSFAENAELKAQAAADAAGLPALADDSGLEVAALDGAPGIHSARWAGEARDFSAAMQRVQSELAAKRPHHVKSRRANFTCALTLAWPGGNYRTFEGRVFGRLVWPPRGQKGFGYDPIFVPEGHRLTFGEMEPEHKHAMSHRARAFERLIHACLEPAEPS
jgi:XTP/dITP diphosphohydrolase